MTDPWQGQALNHSVTALGEWLARWQAIWRPRPFAQQPVPWEADHPSLSRFLRGLPEGSLARWEQQPWALEAPGPWADWVREARRLTAIEAPPALVDRWRPRGIKARKWRQVEALAWMAGRHHPGGAWLDWCSGKGHLGRTLAADTGEALVAVERDPVLVADGQAAADRDGLNARFVVADALGDGVQELRPDRHGVALHACGSLHQRLLNGARQGQLSAVTVAPCCYHRIQGEQHTPVSQVGQALALALDRRTLRLPTMEVVVAAPRVEAVRKRSVTWRAALDLLRREALGADVPALLPHLPSAWFRGSFEDLVHHAQRELDWPTPPPARWQPLLDDADEHARLARALALPRWLFRRPLELYLVGDAALGLVEAGWEVRVQRFCARDLSPRNLLVIGTGCR